MEQIKIWTKKFTYIVIKWSILIRYVNFNLDITLLNLSNFVKKIKFK